MKDLTILMEDRPGTLADVGEALGNAGVNIEGMCGFGAGGQETAHLLVADESAARAALEGAGIAVAAERDVIVADMSGQDRPGTMGTMARKVADAGVNIEFLYLARGTRGVLGTSDDAAARAALGI
jgi:hypothetical protein